MALWTSFFVLREPGLCNSFKKAGVLLFFRLDWTYSSSALRKGDGSSFSWRSSGAVVLSSISIMVFSISVQISAGSWLHVLSPLNGARHFHRCRATSRSDPGFRYEQQKWIVWRQELKNTTLSKCSIAQLGYTDYLRG